MVDKTILSVPHNHARLAPLHRHISSGTDTADADIRNHKPIDTDSTVARIHNSLRMNSQLKLANLSILPKKNALDSAPFKLSFANLVDDSGNFTYMGMAPDSVLHTLVTEFVRCMIDGSNKHRILLRDTTTYRKEGDTSHPGTFESLDFDLLELCSNVVVLKADVRSGTMLFTARDILKAPKESYRFVLNHDLESVYYFIIWYSAGYRGKGNKTPIIQGRERDPLWLWKNGTLSNKISEKEEYMETRDKDLHGLLRFSIDDETMTCALDGIRNRYCQRRNDIIKFRKMQKRKEAEILSTVIKQAREDNLPALEMRRLMLKKHEELDRQNEMEKPPTAISFKTWLIGAKLKGLATRNDDECRHDCCVDNLLKTDEICDRTRRRRENREI